MAKHIAFTRMTSPRERAAYLAKITPRDPAPAAMTNHKVQPLPPGTSTVEHDDA